MRVPVARRNLFSDRTRLAISVAGVAVAILLILVLQGVYKGILDVSTAYVRNVDADLWVAQAGSRSMTHSYSLIAGASSLEQELAATDGVAEAHPLVLRPTTIDIKGKENSLRVIGYHPQNGVGGPWDLAEGRGVAGPGEIVVDKVFLDSNGLKLGDTVSIEARDFRIVGVSQNTNVLIFKYAFADIEEIRDVLGPDRVNFFMVKVTDPAGIEQVKEDISARHPELVVFTRSQFADINGADIRDAFLPILGVLVGIAFFVGIAIVGLVVYSATVERSREYGILKAVGAGSRTLYGIVFEQSLLSGLMGYVIGGALAFAVAAFIQRFVPQVSIAFSWTHFASAFGAALVMSILASYIPIRKIDGIDPAIVFKA